MTQPWLRLYRGTVNNPKLQRLGLEVVGFWTNCLCLSDDDGYLPAVSDIAWSMRLNETQVETFLETLQRNNLVDAEEGGTLRLHDWSEHQKVSDLSTDRVRKFREKQQKTAPQTEKPGHETPCNVSETVQIRTDTEKKEKNMSGSSAPDGFEQFWKSYPRTPNMSKVKAAKAWQRQKCSQLPQDQLLAAVAKYKAFLATETKKNGREYPAKHAQGWLTERRWEGFAEAGQAQQQKHGADWADSIPEWAAFKAKLSPAEWSTWFAPIRPNGSVASLVARTPFEFDRITQAYLSRLVAHFGENFELKVTSP